MAKALDLAPHVRSFLDLSDAGGDAIAAMIADAIDRIERASASDSASSKGVARTKAEAADAD